MGAAKLSDGDVYIAVEMRRSGATYAQIADMFGVTTPTALRAVKTVLDPRYVEELRRKQAKRESRRRNNSLDVQQEGANAARRWREQNRDLNRARNNAYMAKRRADRRPFMLWLKDQPCMDCGVKFAPCAMQFDHRPGTTKVLSIGERFAAPSLDVLLDEITKCDLVCANCHSVRTFTRRQEA